MDFENQNCVAADACELGRLLHLQLETSIDGRGSGMDARRSACTGCGDRHEKKATTGPEKCLHRITGLMEGTASLMQALPLGVSICALDAGAFNTLRGRVSLMDTSLVADAFARGHQRSREADGAFEFHRQCAWNSIRRGVAARGATRREGPFDPSVRTTIRSLSVDGSAIIPAQARFAEPP